MHPRNSNPLRQLGLYNRSLNRQILDVSRCVTLGSLRCQRSGKLLNSLHGSLFPKIQWELHQRGTSHAIENIGQQDRIAFAGQPLSHLALRWTDSCDVGQKDDAENTTALPRTVDEAIGYSVRGTNFGLLANHEPSCRDPAEWTVLN